MVYGIVLPHYFGLSRLSLMAPLQVLHSSSHDRIPAVLDSGTPFDGNWVWREVVGALILWAAGLKLSVRIFFTLEILGMNILDILRHSKTFLDILRQFGVPKLQKNTQGRCWIPTVEALDVKSSQLLQIPHFNDEILKSGPCDDCNILQQLPTKNQSRNTGSDDHVHSDTCVWA